MDKRRAIVGLGAWAGVSLALLFVGAPAPAVEIKAGQEVTIAEDEVIEDDLYMTGETMTVKGRVKGDVVASGKVVRIEGVIEGDLMAAGQAVIIEGAVQDDVRIAGMTLKLGERASVADDLFTAGFSFESSAGSQVGGRTSLTGYQALIGGDHGENLVAALVGLRLEGRVAGDVEATVESEAGPAWWTQFMQSPVPIPVVESGLTLTSDARVEGDLSYLSTSPADVADGAQVLGETRHEVKETKAAPTVSMGQRLARSLRWFVALLLVGVLLFWLVPEKMLGVTNTLVERPMASFGWGFVTLIAFPVAMLVVLVITLVLVIAFGLMTLGKLVAAVVVLGLLIELLMGVKLWIAVAFIALVVVAFAVGRRLLKGGEGLGNRSLSLLVGLAVLAVLGLIPFLGGLVGFLVALAGLGAGFLWSVGYLKRAEAD